MITLVENHIKVGEIIGYRCWEVVQTNFRAEPEEELYFRFQYYVDESQMQHIWLRSFISTHTIWKPKIPISCRYNDYTWFWGIHAFKEPELLTKYLVKMRLDSTSIVIAMGTVKLWGTVIEHEKGWRGEFGAIRSIDQFS